MTFKELNISSPLISTLDKLGYHHPTPIQQQAIPHVLAGRDLFGCAQTGTGKTAAFSLPILQLLSTASSQTQVSQKIQALILAPTRELAIQIGQNIQAYQSGLGIRSTIIFGGVSAHQQIKSIQQKPHILVATPGRLLDLMQQGYLSLTDIRYFVLDEADRMLDMGFINDIKKVIAKLPAKRQTLFFSATVAPAIMKLAESLLHQPVKVSVTPVSSSSTLVKQEVYHVAKEDKRSLLKHLITKRNIEHAIVFTRTKRGADRVAKELNKNGIRSESIHGDKSQNAREKALSGFKEKSVRILVATDIASRGIDIDKLNYVINFEIPEQAETYVHRIGRTGRAGNEGVALSLCTQDEMPYLTDINKLIKQQIAVVKNHPFA